MKIHYIDPQAGAKGYGWATANEGLKRALGELAALGGPESEACFVPIADHDMTPIAPLNPDKINLGYCFFEFQLGPNAESNSSKYDQIFAGSTWCKDRLAERGISSEVLIQGVDHTIFKPGERKKDGQFRIFSGGKFEYRKGQDLVIAAFKEFAQTHPEAHLVCSWFNPWPQLLLSMQQSDCIKWDARGKDQVEFMESLLANNGIDRSQFTILPQLSQQKLAQAMPNTDCGLFPNRCEGGTNLVLMEYSATNNWTVANTETGHMDIMDLISVRIPCGTDSMQWAQQTVEQVTEALWSAYELWKDGDSPNIASRKQRTWEAAATQIIERAQSLTPSSVA